MIIPCFTNSKNYPLRKPLVFLIPVLLLTSCASVQKYNQEITALHSVESLQQDVDVAYKKLQKFHPRLYLYTPKKSLDATFDSLKHAITKPMNSHDFYKKISVAVANVRQGHAGVIAPMEKFTKKERKQLNKKKFELNNLNFEYLDNAIWVKSTVDKDSTLVGSEVQKINNESVSDLLKVYAKRFSSDGYNNTFYNRRVGLYLPQYYYYDKGYLDSIQVTFQKNDSVFSKMFRRIPKDSVAGKIKKDSVKTTPKKLTKAERKLAKLKRKQKIKDNNKYGYVKSKKHYTRNFKFIHNDRVAYMKIRGFKTGEYEDFYKEVFTKLDSAKSKALVIDLRDNSGGRLREIYELYSYLTDKEFKFVEEGETNVRFPTLKALRSRRASSFGSGISKGIATPVLFFRDLFKVHKKEGKKYYKFKSSKLQKPNPLNYKGSVYVLINGHSFSSSSVLSANLQASKRATLVGEETGGAYNSTVAGFTNTVTLPNSRVQLYFGLLVLETPYKRVLKGYGVQPDVTIIPTQNDRINNRDPELEWVLQNIK